MRNFLFLALILNFSLLTACSGLVPASQPAPQTWQLEAFTPAKTTAVVSSAAGLKVLVEQPLTSSPLASTNLWYAAKANQLSPFSSNKWVQSLDKQIQLRLSQFLAQQPNIATSLVDAPGFLPDLRLKLSLQDWYLVTANNSLKISLQLNLLNTKGENLLSKNWQEEVALEALNPASLVAASQTWLENWAKEITELLIGFKVN